MKVFYNLDKLSNGVKQSSLIPCCPKHLTIKYFNLSNYNVLKFQINYKGSQFVDICQYYKNLIIAEYLFEINSFYLKNYSMAFIDIERGKLLRLKWWVLK